jgi:hypothetical protein
MDAHLGPAYARVWSREQSLRDLDGQTVYEALDAGESPKRVWRAVHAALELPAADR